MIEHQTSTHRRAPQERWLRSMKLSDLRRLSDLCGVEPHPDAARDELIANLHKASEENELTESLFRDFTRSATAFDVRNVRESTEARFKEQDKRRSQQMNAELSGINNTLRSLEEEAKRNKLLRTVFSTIFGGLGTVITVLLTIAAIAGVNVQGTLGEARATAKTVDEIKVALGDIEGTELIRLKQLNNTFEKSSKDFDTMMVSLTVNMVPGTIMKLNSRLDKLRSTKLYHLRSFAGADMRGDATVLAQLRGLIRDRVGTDKYRRLRSLSNIHEAILRLPDIYDEKGQIDVKALRRARESWEELHRDVRIIKRELEEQDGSFDMTELLKRLKGTVYHVEAGLAIQEFRALQRYHDEDTGKFLTSARGKCTQAIQTDPSLTMAYIWYGLTYSLEINRQRQMMDDMRAVRKIVKEGAMWYREAVKRSQTPELKIMALNNLAFLYVKASDAHVNAAKEEKRNKTDYIATARALLKVADKEIKKAIGVPYAADPIVYTTQADIEILQVGLAEAGDLKRMRDQGKYKQILDILRKAVDSGYTGYSQPKALFFEKRPHFRHLAQLNDSYETDVEKLLNLPSEAAYALLPATSHGIGI